MQQGEGSEAQVTWEDQQNINKFGRLNNRFHELEDEIKVAKSVNYWKLARGVTPVINLKPIVRSSDKNKFEAEQGSNTAIELQRFQETNGNLEDASNELMISDEDVVRFQIGEVFAHVGREEVESRLEKMKEDASKQLEKLKEEKKSLLAQMAELKKILYGKFKDSINLEED